MIYNTLNYLIFIFFIFIFGNEKSSSEIQKDIDSRKSELNNIRNEIKVIEENLLKKNNAAINTTEILLELENKISLTEKLIRSLSKEEIYISELIINTENQINGRETALYNLKKQLSSRLKYLYIHGKSELLEIILLANDWNNIIYHIKYLTILSEYELKIRTKIQKNLFELSEKKIKLQNEKNIKIQLLYEKKEEEEKLTDDKQKRNKLLGKIKNAKLNLEKSRKEKFAIINEMESLIKKLYSDKASRIKREKELSKIRAELNKSTTENFIKMKGKLMWPVYGNVINKYGIKRNPKTGIIIENVGIDIATKNEASVKAVLDGVISTITYISGHGNVIIIDHGGGFSTVYAKIDDINVNENDYVQMGNTIAKIKKTNNNTKSILHFEIWGDQQKHNPEEWLIRK